MTAREKWTFNLLALVVSASGLAYLWMKYGMASGDPFALVNHPWQPWMLAIHVLASPWFLVMFGVLVNSHISLKLAAESGQDRRSGYLSLVAFVTMTFSGYALQVATNPRTTRAMLVLHLVSSGLFVLAYGAHLVIGLRTAVARPPAECPEPHAAAPCSHLDSHAQPPS